MSKVITFSRVFPDYHPKAGQPTFFVDMFWNSFRNEMFELPDAFRPFINGYVDLKMKHYLDPLIVPGVKRHTVREGHRFKAGEMFSPRVWGDDVNVKSGRRGPYQSKQVIIGPDTLIKKEIPIEFFDGLFVVNGNAFDVKLEEDQAIIEEIADNDGLNKEDLLAWFHGFKPKKPFDGQIIIWNDEGIDY